MTINWKDHLVNLLVVILGITIAFYLESWREDRKIAEAETTYLRELENSLMRDVVFLDTLIKANASQQATLDRLLDGESIPHDSVGHYLYQLFYKLPFAPQNAVYESMKASGGIKSMRDFQLAANIMVLYEQEYQGMYEWDKALDEYIRDFYRPFVINRFQFTLKEGADIELLKSKSI